MVGESNNENESLLDREKKVGEHSSKRGQMSMASNGSFTKYDCGWCGCYPAGLQVFNRPAWAVFFIGLGALVEGMAVNGMLHFFISTIEKRFEMPSYQAGLMSGAFDIASLIFLIPVTYLGGRRRAHKPLYIAIGMVVLGCGSLVFCLPHFINGPYTKTSEDDLCTLMDTKHVPRVLTPLSDQLTHYSRPHATHLHLIINVIKMV